MPQRITSGASAGSKTGKIPVIGLNGTQAIVFPGLCLTSIAWEEGQREEKEFVCGEETIAHIDFEPYQQVSVEGTVLTTYLSKLFTKRDFISFTDADVDAHYIKIFERVTGVSAKITDQYQVMEVSFNKATSTEMSFSATIMRKPNFQPTT